MTDHSDKHHTLYAKDVQKRFKAGYTCFRAAELQNMRVEKNLSVGDPCDTPRHTPQTSQKDHSKIVLFFDDNPKAAQRLVLRRSSCPS